MKFNWWLLHKNPHILELRPSNVMKVKGVVFVALTALKGSNQKAEAVSVTLENPLSTSLIRATAE